MDGVAADFDTIADGSYPVSRPLYFYVKAAHVGTVPGIQEYVAEFTSDAAVGEGRLPVRAGPDPARRRGARRGARRRRVARADDAELSVATAAVTASATAFPVASPVVAPAVRPA